MKHLCQLKNVENVSSLNCGFSFKGNLEMQKYKSATLCMIIIENDFLSSFPFLNFTYKTMNLYENFYSYITKLRNFSFHVSTSHAIHS